MCDYFENIILKYNIKNYLLSFKKKYSGKRVLLYGTGKLFCTLLNKGYFEGINIIGVSDLKYDEQDNCINDFGFNSYSPINMIKANPDVILCTLEKSYLVFSALKLYAQNHNNSIKVETLIPVNYFRLFYNKFIATFLTKFKYLFNKNKKYNNVIYVTDDFGNKKIYRKQIQGLKIIFIGNNNTICIHKNCLNKFINSFIYCTDNCHFEINKTYNNIRGLKLVLNAKNSRVTVGKNSLFSGGNIVLSGENNLSVKIGNNCYFGSNLNIRTSDAHSLIDNISQEILNKGEDIIIGNNVWLANNVTVNKGVKLSDYTVVASNSLVNKKFNENNILIAGIPARVNKKDISWRPESPS